MLFPGHEAWQTGDYGGGSLDRGKTLNLTQSRLGDFVYKLLCANGYILSTSVMRASFPRSYVQMTVSLPAGKREEFERSSGYALEEISELRPA